MRDRKPVLLPKTSVTRYLRRHGVMPRCYRCEKTLPQGAPVIIAGRNKGGSRYYHVQCWLKGFQESNFEPTDEEVERFFKEEK